MLAISRSLFLFPCFTFVCILFLEAMFVTSPGPVEAAINADPIRPHPHLFWLRRRSPQQPSNGASGTNGNSDSGTGSVSGSGTGSISGSTSGTGSLSNTNQDSGTSNAGSSPSVEPQASQSSNVNTVTSTSGVTINNADNQTFVTNATQKTNLQSALLNVDAGNVDNTTNITVKGTANGQTNDTVDPVASQSSDTGTVTSTQGLTINNVDGQNVTANMSSQAKNNLQGDLLNVGNS